jgi:hypothetical protein
MRGEEGRQKANRKIEIGLYSRGICILQTRFFLNKPY